MSDEKEARDFASLLTLPKEGQRRALEMFVTFLTSADETPEDGLFDLADEALMLTDEVAEAFGIEED